MNSSKTNSENWNSRVHKKTIRLALWTGAWLLAIGLALGVDVVGVLSHQLLDSTNIIKSDAEISFLVTGIAISYLAAIFIHQWRCK